MSKAVHWQVPFCSLKGVQYRVDIYDETPSGSPSGGSDWPVVLTGGATPFVTDEDNDDNFFAPVRTQTGQLTVIDMDGTLMETLIPSDNTARPVRLIRVSDSAVMWQGFLSCEAYSQDYTSRAQELTLNVNSVLAAMESVKVGDDFSGFKTIKDVIVYVLGKTNGFVGSSKMIKYWYMPSNASNILTKYIDTTVFFDEKEQSSENSTTYVSVGLSCTEVLRKICAYMGWTARESGTALVFCSDDCNTLDWYSNTNAKIGTINKYSESMPGFDYRGTGHTKELRQGAKSVEVVAKVDGYDVDMQLPECPVGSLLEHYVDINSDKLYSLANTNTEFNNKYKFNNLLGAYTAGVWTNPNVPGDHALTNLKLVIGGYLDDDANSTISMSLLSHGTNNPLWNALKNSPYYSSNRTGALNINIPMFSCMAKLAIEDEEKTEHETNDGLFVAGCNKHDLDSTSSTPPSFCTITDAMHLFRMKSINRYMLNDGYFVISLNGTFFGADGQHGGGTDTYESSQIKITMSLKIGDKYWNGSTFTTTFSTFTAKIKDGEIVNTDDEHSGGLYIPISSLLYGSAELSIYHEIYGMCKDNAGKGSIVYSYFLNTLSLSHYSPENKLSDRSENHYFKLLTLNDGTPLNFSDEVSVNTDIASDMNNKPSPSIIMNSETEPMTTLTYSDGTSERPEKHLLNRLAAYYGAVRRKITLEIDRPSNPLPLTKVTGYDNRTYLPLAESRDWRMDKSTVTMFETT